MSLISDLWLAVWRAGWWRSLPFYFKGVIWLNLWGVLDWLLLFQVESPVVQCDVFFSSQFAPLTLTCFFILFLSFLFDMTCLPRSAMTSNGLCWCFCVCVFSNFYSTVLWGSCQWCSAGLCATGVCSAGPLQLLLGPLTVTITVAEKLFRPATSWKRTEKRLQMWCHWWSVVSVQFPIQIPQLQSWHL